MNQERTREHEWLERLTGEWTTESEMIEPGKPPAKMTGSASVRNLGGLWALVEMRETVEGTPQGNLMTLGYDPAKGRVVGTFVSSMSADLWLYDGALDAAGEVLTLSSEGPAMDGSGTALYHDIVEMSEPDRWVFRSEAQVEGRWTEFMRMECRRVG